MYIMLWSLDLNLQLSVCYVLGLWFIIDTYRTASLDRSTWQDIWVTGFQDFKKIRIDIVGEMIFKYAEPEMRSN